jgi:hypothetical protein
MRISTFDQDYYSSLLTLSMKKGIKEKNLGLNSLLMTPLEKFYPGIDA